MVAPFKPSDAEHTVQRIPTDRDSHQLLEGIGIDDVGDCVARERQFSTPISHYCVDAKTLQENRLNDLPKETQEDMITHGLGTYAMDLESCSRVSNTPQRLADPSQVTQHKSNFDMAISKPDGSVIMRRAKLDTGAQVDVLSEDVVNVVGVQMKPYDGPSLNTLGKETIRPLGKVSLEWHISGKLKTYTTDFLVVSAVDSCYFDVLLIDKTIGEIGFYTINHDVWLLIR